MRKLSIISIALLFVALSGCNGGATSANETEHSSDTGDQSSSDAGSGEDAGDAGRWPQPREGCNGHPDLCDRPFDEVVFPATHNAMSNAEDGWEPPNQNLPLEDQLVDGIRTFLLDVHEEDGEILLCHNLCDLGSRPLIDAMEELKSFLEANPDEVVTIIFEDHVSAQQLTGVVEDAGLVELLYTHDTDTGWPTLGDMIDADTRLVITAENASPPPSWLHHVWDVAWDTPYDFSSSDEFNCEANRGSTDHDLFLINHWVGDPLPSEENAQETNTYEMLMQRADECRQQWDRGPTFLAVDFYDVGDLFEVVDVLNDLEPPR